MIKLSLENDEVSAGLGAEVDASLLVLFESINNLKEITLSKEEVEIVLANSFGDFFDWVEEGVLLIVSLKGIRLELSEAIEVCT